LNFSKREKIDPTVGNSKNSERKKNLKTKSFGKKILFIFKESY